MQKKIIYFPPPKGTWYISYHFLSDVHIRSIWWLSNENRPTWHMFWTDPISIRYLENAALKLVKKWTVVIVAFGNHRLMQEPRRNLSDDSELLDIVNNCRQELRLKNWQHIRIRPWQGIKYSFRSKAKVYYTPRNLIEGGGTEKIPSSPNLSRSSCRSESRQTAVCITCFLQETKSCATLKCMHLIKELNARNLILQTLVMLSDDYMWSKNVWIYQIQTTSTLILMNYTPKNY